METPHVQMPGYQLYEYLLVLNPHEELRNKIMTIKNEFAEKYKAPAGKYMKPHIALVRFTHLSMMEEKIMHRLQAIAMGITPFKVELNNYGSFPTHTILINITSKLPVQNLVKHIREAQRLMKFNNEHKPHFIEEPHLAIARKLRPWQYEQAWLEYAHRHFTGRFIADNMLLVKRKVGDKAYQILRRFEFQNLPVATKQGSLFGTLWQ
jgi:2'-5' RNA ligase